MTGRAKQNNRTSFYRWISRTEISVACVFLLACVSMSFCGCQFPYKIDPSGNCLFVKNEDYKQPELQSPFLSQTGTQPNDTATQTATVPATTLPANQSSLPGVVYAPGAVGGVAPSPTATTGTGIVRGNNAGTLLVPGSGPIVLVAPEEQIALIGTEVILFANYKGDDDYLRIGERIEWSLGGVGHIQTTNKTQCSNVLALDFNKDKKMSDRYAVTSTLHYEGVIDRGSADEQGAVPHLAGQSWISIRSAEEGTSTVTAYAPTIKDWNRRTSSGIVHWIDAEWVYPQADITKYDDPKIFVTKVKKRSSGSPCPGWVVRYEVTGGPNAGLGPNRSKTVEVIVDANGEAAVDLHLLEGSSGTSTVKATIVRPAGVDGGTKRLELHSATLTNLWSAEAPLSLQTIPPNQMRWGEQATWTIYCDNPSSVDKPGVITLPLPQHIKLISSNPQPTNVTQQSDGGELVTWQIDFRARSRADIKFVVQAVTNDSALKSQQLNVELTPKLSMFPLRDANSQSGQSQPNQGGTGGLDYGQGTGGSTLPPYTPDTSGLTGTLPGGGSGSPWGGGRPGGGTRPGGSVNNQGNCDPTTFAGQLKVEYKTAGAMWLNEVNYVDVIITNNAQTPFYQGRVRIQISENLAFPDDNGRPATDNQGRLIRAQNYYIGPEAQQATIQPGQSYSMPPIAVIPMQQGTVTFNATVTGKPSNSTSDDYVEISGASAVGSVRAMQR